MRITLIGYMASGKSTIGRKLASHTGFPFIDLDEAIALEVGQSVPDFLREKGELKFRKTEKDVLHAQMSEENFILSSGGGTPCYYDNVDFMLENSFVVYLQWPMKTLVQRISVEREQRPLLDGIQEADLYEYVAKHVFDRRPFYEKAHCTVDAASFSEEELLNHIIEEWKKKQIS